jgi:hypothetical protein
MTARVGLGMRFFFPKGAADGEDEDREPHEKQ